MIHRVFLLLLALAITARAHPVAQGTMELTAHADHLAIHARVANEQVYVEAAFTGAKAAERLEEAWRLHGDYLLRHLQVRAAGALLSGTVEKVTPSPDTSAQGFCSYDLRLPWPASGRPATLELRQTMLNEIEFAPGNPWEATFLVRLSEAGGPTGEPRLFTHREPLTLSLGPAARTPHSSIFGEYLRHGLHHILEGWDHLLFMAALVVAVRRLRELVAVVTAFTLAHTLTLTLSVFDIVRLPSRIVEPVIAFSIVAVAVQNVLRPRAAHGWMRLGAAFGFGLFHGLGFAGGLLEAMQGFAGLSVGTALAGFSLGVELGHQVVVLPIYALIAIVCALLRQPAARERFAAAAMRYASIVIAAAGTFYLVAALRG